MRIISIVLLICLSLNTLALPAPTFFSKYRDNDSNYSGLLGFISHPISTIYNYVGNIIDDKKKVQYVDTDLGKNTGKKIIKTLGSPNEIENNKETKQVKQSNISTMSSSKNVIAENDHRKKPGKNVTHTLDNHKSTKKAGKSKANYSTKYTGRKSNMDEDNDRKSHKSNKNEDDNDRKSHKSNMNEDYDRKSYNNKKSNNKKSNNSKYSKHNKSTNKLTVTTKDNNKATKKLNVTTKDTKTTKKLNVTTKDTKTTKKLNVTTKDTKTTKKLNVTTKDTKTTKKLNVTTKDTKTTKKLNVTTKGNNKTTNKLNVTTKSNNKTSTSSIVPTNVVDNKPIGGNTSSTVEFDTSKITLEKIDEDKDVPIIG